jgi:hypothetical protein
MKNPVISGIYIVFYLGDPSGTILAYGMDCQAFRRARGSFDQSEVISYGYVQACNDRGNPYIARSYYKKPIEYGQKTPGTGARIRQSTC